MQESEALFDQIEAYIRGNMDEAAQADFESRIASDARLAELVRLHRVEKEALDLLVEQDIRKNMEIWDREDAVGKSDGGSPFAAFRGKRLLVLLAVLFLLALLGWRLLIPRTEKPAPEERPGKEQSIPRNTETQTTPAGPIAEEDSRKTPPEATGKKSVYDPEFIALAAESYQTPEHLASVLRSSGQEAPMNSSLATGMDAFAQKLWATAIRRFQRVTPADGPETYAQAREWLAHAFFCSGQYLQAAAEFTWLLQQNFGEASNERAEWYLLLCLLPDYSNQKAQADALLDKMLAPENLHSFREDALKLDAALKR